MPKTARLNFELFNSKGKVLKQKNLKFDPKLFDTIFNFARDEAKKKKRTVIAPPIA